MVQPHRGFGVAHKSLPQRHEHTWTPGALSAKYGSHSVMAWIATYLGCSIMVRRSSAPASSRGRQRQEPKKRPAMRSAGLRSPTV